MDICQIKRNTFSKSESDATTVGARLKRAYKPDPVFFKNQGFLKGSNKSKRTVQLWRQNKTSAYYSVDCFRLSDSQNLLKGNFNPNRQQ